MSKSINNYCIEYFSNHVFCFTARGQVVQKFMFLPNLSHPILAGRSLLSILWIQFHLVEVFRNQHSVMLTVRMYHPRIRVFHRQFQRIRPCLMIKKTVTMKLDLLHRTVPILIRMVPQLFKMFLKFGRT